ncbi:MAG: HAMP domain-containing histidine kinase [Verrucomicrobiaceae bacterium]|nr:HAMP domain-containing histidine kinase [Verrucomicrobiaceae bacterium]
MPAPGVPSVTNITLGWLLRLRWVGVAAQITAIWIAGVVLELELPWRPLLAVIGLTALSNVLLQLFAKPFWKLGEGTLTAVIAGDVLLLTTLIYFTGGASNPFTSFYLVLVALAAMSLSPKGLTAIVVLATAAYFFVYYNGIPLRGPGGIGEIGCPAYSLHLQGMAVAFFLTALCVAYFVRRMLRSLQTREAALAAAEARAARADQFSALAALAAGVAHELGSPLGTIAVASHELELTLAKQAAPGPLEDATLIRQEVERCRRILDRLDQRSTAGTGAVSEVCTTTLLIEEVKTALSAAMLARLLVHDLTENSTLNLPVQPVVQALVIFIQNACEADTSGKPVELEISLAADQLLLAVLDHGPGMSAAAVKHAGEPFFTTKPPRQGMGLGLFLVRTLATQLGGEMQHLARDGGGTIAALQLPAVHPDS